jgi:ArsR family transcriptional regulator, arsenate/arsenite/antimonite-responsive transcriptional repressor
MNLLPVLQSACCPPSPAPLDVGACEDYARRFKALADPTRVALVARLAHGEDVCVCDLVAGSRLSQPTISHHLAILRRAGLVTSRKRGTWAYYRLVPDAVRELAEALAAPPAAGF